MSLGALAWGPWPGSPGLGALAWFILQDIVPLGPLPKKGEAIEGAERSTGLKGKKVYGEKIYSEGTQGPLPKRISVF